MKKLCFVTTASITIRSFLLPTLSYLRQHTDWELTVICDTDPNLAADQPQGVRYIPVEMKRGISLGGIAACAKMAAIFRREMFDLVQYSTPNASLYASLAAFLTGVPVRLYCQWGIAYVGFHGVKRHIFRFVEKLVCRLSTRIEPDSFGNLRFSRNSGLYNESKSGVVWNGSASGVDLQKFDISGKPLWREDIRDQYSISPDAPVFGFVGRITGDKGINELISAFQEVLKIRPEAYLLLVGNIEKETTLNQALLHWAQQHPQVCFCGHSSQVEHFMAAMDIFVLPSYREGFGSTVIEAQAMGLPVIVTDIPGPTDAMSPDQTGLTVPVRDVQALTQAILTLAEDKEKRLAMGTAGRSFVEQRFDQHALMQKILEDRTVLLS